MTVGRRQRLVQAVVQGVIAGGLFGLMRYYVPFVGGHVSGRSATFAGLWFAVFMGAFGYWTVPLTAWFRRLNR